MIRLKIEQGLTARINWYMAFSSGKNNGDEVNKG